MGRCESILGPGGEGCLVDHLDPPMRRLAYRGLTLANAPAFGHSCGHSLYPNGTVRNFQTVFLRAPGVVGTWRKFGTSTATKFIWQPGPGRWPWQRRPPPLWHLLGPSRVPLGNGGYFPLAAFRNHRLPRSRDLARKRSSELRRVSGMGGNESPRV